VNVPLFQSLIEALHDVVALQDSKGLLVYVSPSAPHLLGFTPEELLGKPALDLFHPDDHCLFEPSSVEPSPETPAVEVRCRRRDGSYRRLRVGRGILRDADGSSFSFYRLRDVDDDKEPASDKMPSIRRLAGGVAHEFNNLLTVITGYTLVLMDGREADDPVYESLLHIRDAADRAAELVRQLLAIAGRQILRPAMVHVNILIRDLGDVLKRILGPAIQLDLNLDPSLPAIEIDPVSIAQVLMDLAANALDAMPEGGKFTVATMQVPAGKRPGPALQLTVSDTGHGMDEQTLGHLFEPFFTTKPVGKGAGLSLAAAFGTIRQCGGDLRVASQPGCGTTFTLLLPSAPPRKKR
jgi:two-component system cell cycle sensor histidine kinase/response regulator CckA